MLNKTFIKCGILMLFISLVNKELYAQKLRNNEVQQKQSLWASHIEVDGDLNDWDENALFSLHGDEFKYLIQNDGEFIYLAFQVSDKDRQFQILTRGVDVSFNGAKYRKAIQTIRYPLADRHDFKEKLSDNRFKNLNPREAAMQSIRGIGVKGFDQLTDGLISLSNTFGIVAKSLLTDDNLLNIEIQVPISLLKSKNHGIDIEDAVAINIKAHDLVNPPTKKNNKNRRASSQYVVQYANNTGVWLEIALAKPD